MANLAASPLSPAEREALADQLIRVIGTQVPSLVGIAANWIQLAADSIIDRFEAEGIFGAIDIWPDEISGLIDGLLTPENRGKAYTVARRIVFELDHFRGQRVPGQAEGNAPAAVSAEDPQIPMDETHDFGIMAKELLDSADSSLEGPALKLTEKQARAALARLAGNSDLDFTVVARPKPQAWTAIS